MSEIIYLKDILFEGTDKNKKKTARSSGRPKLKPFKYEKTIKSSLVEKKKKKKEDEKHRL